MSIPYKVITRKNPQDKTAPVKYYPLAISRGYIEFENLLVKAGKNTTLNPEELRMSFKLAFEEAGEQLANGMTVSFGEQGYMHPTFRSTGSDTEEEVSADNIKDIMPHFAFGPKFRKNLKDASVEKKKN